MFRKIQADIVSNYEAGRTALCRQDFEAIRDWTRQANFTIENANLASEAGVFVMNAIARRYQETFPQLLTETYSPDRFLFRHTWSERTNTSIRAFASGLFGESGAQNVIYEDVPDNDWFLRPFDFCPDFDEEVEGWNPSQRLAFRDGPEFVEMLEEINRKLGFRGSNQLSLGTVLQVWNWCTFETSSTFEFSNSETGGDSPWCAAFSVAHHLLLEYSEDLFHFYTAGYGVRNQRLMENLHCGLMQDLLTHIQSDDGPTTRIFVSYVQEILGMLVTLGSFRDTWPLHQHNYAQQSARNWLTSLMTPLGTNLAVVRYE